MPKIINTRSHLLSLLPQTIVLIKKGLIMIGLYGAEQKIVVRVESENYDSPRRNHINCFKTPIVILETKKIHTFMVDESIY